MRMSGRSMIGRKLTRKIWEKNEATLKKALKGRYKVVPWEKRNIRPPTIMFVCPKRCESGRAERPMTKAEVEAWRHVDWTSDVRSSAIHRVWHEFGKAFYKKDAKGEADKWKWIGYDLIKRAEAFAAKHPGAVEIVRCDDDYHAGSRIVVVHHELPDYYWGTSFVFIPQCTGEPPTKFFFYDNHAKEFLASLKGIVRKHAQKGDRL
jgi:hypothetical protein